MQLLHIADSVANRSPLLTQELPEFSTQCSVIYGLFQPKYWESTVSPAMCEFQALFSSLFRYFVCLFLPGTRYFSATQALISECSAECAKESRICRYSRFPGAVSSLELCPESPCHFHPPRHSATSPQISVGKLCPNFPLLVPWPSNSPNQQEKIMKLSILVSRLSVVTVFHCLISSVFKMILHIFVCLFFTVPGRREKICSLLLYCKRIWRLISPFLSS